jgi:hypothetical protein
MSLSPLEGCQREKWQSSGGKRESPLLKVLAFFFFWQRCKIATFPSLAILYWEVAIFLDRSIPRAAVGWPRPARFPDRGTVAKMSIVQFSTAFWGGWQVKIFVSVAIVDRCGKNVMRIRLRLLTMISSRRELVCRQLRSKLKARFDESKPSKKNPGEIAGSESLSIKNMMTPRSLRADAHYLQG